MTTLVNSQGTNHQTMTNYFIVRKLLPPYKYHRYMHDGTCYDYLGQILIQKGIDIPDKCRFPSDLDHCVPPFTFVCRSVIHNTKLTLDILQLDILDPTTHPRRLEELLAPHGITLTWR